MLWYVKAGIGVILVASLVGYHLWEKKQSYDAGYTKASLKYEQAGRDSVEAFLELKMEELGVAIRDGAKDAQRARDKATELSIMIEGMKVTIDDISEYERVASEMECDRFGSDFLRLFNQPSQ